MLLLPCSPGNMASFCDSGVSLTSRRLQLSHDDRFDIVKQACPPMKRLNKDDCGITLEELRNRSIEEKLRGLDQLDWRSQIIESSTNPSSISFHVASGPTHLQKQKYTLKPDPHEKC